MSGSHGRAPAGFQFGPTATLALWGVVALALAAAGMPVLREAGDAAFLALVVASGALAFVAARQPVSDARTALVLIVGIGLAMRLVVLPTPAVFSTDVFRYVWDGRVQAAGINPYRYVPSDPALAALRDTLIFPYINRADYAVTIYPPVAQTFFLLATRVAECPLAIKLGLIVCEGVTVFALVGLLAKVDLPVTRVAAYAWHPLPVWEIAGAGHVDGLMVALMTLGTWLVLARGRRAVGAVVVTLAALVKPVAILALPPLWRPWQLGMVLAVPATAALAYLPYLSVGTGVIGFLGEGYLQEQGIASGHGFTLLRLWRHVFGKTPNDTEAYLALALGILVTLSLRFGFRRERSAAIALADINTLCLAFLILASPEYPWYALVAVPLLAVAASPAGWVMTVGVFSFYSVMDGLETIPLEVRLNLLCGLVLAAVLVGCARNHLTMPAAARPSGSPP